MYHRLKISFHPSATHTSPLKSAAGDIIKDRGKLMKRWAEHYQQLYYRENIITDTAIGSISLLPVMNELYVPPSVGEPRRAINSLACGKAPVNDGIPSEAIKAGMNTALLHHLHELLLHCWEEGTVPRTCATSTSSRSTRTRETAATVITTLKCPSSVSLGRPLPV